MNGLEAIKPIPIKSIDSMKEELGKTKTKLAESNDILVVIKNRQTKESDRNKLNEQLGEIKAKIDKINKKVETENDIIGLKVELGIYKKDLLSAQELYKKVEAEYLKNNELIHGRKLSIQERENEIKKYENEWYTEFKDDRLHSIESEELSQGLLSELRSHLKKSKTKLSQLFQSKNSSFRELQKAIGNDNGEQDFVELVEQDLLNVDNREKGIETLLEQISNQFTHPVEEFLKDYKNFEGFVKSFNKKVSKYSISDLTDLKIDVQSNNSLLNDLTKISNIIRVDSIIGNSQKSLFEELNTTDQEENLKTLKKYLTEKKSDIDFKKLFDINLIAKDGSGKSKTINLAKGNESQGTIRMINLMLFLLVIDYFKVADEENKLVFFIDEDVIDSNNT